MGRTTAICTRCGIVMDTKEMRKTACLNRGREKVSYMCPRCAEINESYFTNNNKVVGGVHDGFRFGVEFESTGSDDFTRNMFFRFGFIATHDGSLNSNEELEERGVSSRWGTTYSRENSCEYVSGINNGLKRFTKQFLEIEACMQEGRLTTDMSCGTHCHISYYDMSNGEMEKIRAFYKELFLPLQKVMQDNTSKTERLFGRFFNEEYADMLSPNFNIDWNEHDNRYHWVNLVPDNNIEFRLNKFISASQMLECIKLEKWMVKTIVDNFTSKYVKEDIVTDETINRALAKKTGEKLAKKLQKVYDNWEFDF